MVFFNVYFWNDINIMKKKYINMIIDLFIVYYMVFGNMMRFGY